MNRLPSYEGSGLKWFILVKKEVLKCLPSYEGSGLKYGFLKQLSRVSAVSPRMRGVD